MIKSVLWVGLVLVLLTAFYFTIYSKQSDPIAGEALAKKYCADCHAYPDPSLLSKDIWVSHVLPEMGLRMGVGDKNTLLSKISLKLFDQLNDLGVYPNASLLSEKDWLSIVEFYATKAPDHLPEIAYQSKTTGNGSFTKRYFYTDSGRVPQTSMVKFAPGKNEIWVGSGYREFKKYNLEGAQKTIFRTPSPVIDAIDGKKSLYLSIGNMQPNEDRNGRFYDLNDQGLNGKLIIDSLHRPVQITQADLDADGIEDLVVLEYGYITGQVRMVNGKSGKTSVISQQPGARNLQIKDNDKDGYPDLLILFAQNNEQISLFHNLKGNGFREEVLLSFSSVNGSSYMELADMNNDGHDDLIVSFGDNADYSIINKNYHGVAIYLNDGNYQFKQSWFYPSYGATKTVAGDFDKDGDMDMAMIAFFSDPQKNGSFLYFEQVNRMSFKVSTLGVPHATWLVMDANDMDEDGDLDLILGNFSLTQEGQTDTQRIDCLLLKNEVINK